jgi:ankyrin repeat protein
VRAALESGAPVDERLGNVESTALHLAADGGYEDIVNLLLAHGADANARMSNGVTPLHEAASGGFMSIAIALVNAGAEIDLIDRFGRTPALAAAMVNKSEMVQFLLSLGANPNVVHDGLDVIGWLDAGGLEGHYKHELEARGRPKEVVGDVRGLMSSASSAEEFAAKNGRTILVFSYGAYDLPDPEADRWAKRVAHIFQTPSLLAEVEEQFLEGEDLADARRRRAANIRRAERDARRAPRAS